METQIKTEFLLKLYFSNRMQNIIVPEEQKIKSSKEFFSKKMKEFA